MIGEILAHRVEIVTGVITGVVSAFITGVIPFLVQLRWRRQDLRAGDLDAWRKLTAGLRAIVADCLANHELTMRHGGGRFSTVVLIDSMASAMAEVSAIASSADTARAEKLQRLVDEYYRLDDYKEHPELARARARSILAHCGSPG